MLDIEQNEFEYRSGIFIQKGKQVMKKHLFAEDGKFYKTNLHCHTTYSDGKLSPAEIKEVYKKAGYAAVAFTDHDIFVAHDELADDEFVPLHGYEVEVSQPDTPFRFRKTCHLCFIALDKSNLTQVCLHRSNYMIGNAASYFDEMVFGDAEDYVRSYTPHGVNDMIRKAKDAGFFVSYNHPTWSLETLNEYGAYEGMDALEIFNGSCLASGYDESNAHAYDELLRQGKMIAVTGSDDNHNGKPIDHPLSDSFVAFTMLRAKSIGYEAFAKALREKQFYASTGSLLKALWCEDGVLHVEAEPCESIIFTTGIRRCSRICEGKGNRVTEGLYKIDPIDKYVRVTLIDQNGGRAYTRAYTIEEML